MCRDAGCVDAATGRSFQPWRWLGVIAVGLVVAAGCGETKPTTPDTMPAAGPTRLEGPTMRGRRGAAARPVHFDQHSRPRDASDAFFQSHPVVQLKLKLSDEHAQKLRTEPRQYVLAELVEGESTTYANVAVKLKGAAGSFQNFDDRPAFTLNMSKFKEGQNFHALDKFHLNNSVQDESYACEELCAHLARQSGLPAPRIAHARVWLNDRDLGLYVLKEGFDKNLLKRFFENPNGNLYDGGFLQDIDVDLEKDCGDGPDDHSDLRNLASACRDDDSIRRAALVENVLDVEQFLHFVAFELMTCHWDGYARNRNNYRIYFDPSDGKARFLPHGMDQMFSEPEFSILEYSEPIVMAAVMQNPAWRQRYRVVLKQILPLFGEKELTEHLDRIRQRLQPTLAAISAEADAHHEEVCRDLRERLVARAANLREQVNQPDPGPVEFDEHGQLALDDWEPRQETDDVRLERIEEEGRAELLIATGENGPCIASWRRRVLLSEGKYRLVGKVSVENVEADDDEKGRGAGVRTSGTQRSQGIEGTQPAQEVTFEFEVDEPLRLVELVAELRAKRGQAVFALPLRLVKLDATVEPAPSDAK